MISNQGLKIFQVLAGGPWGGGAVIVRSLTQRLIQEGCQVWVLCLSEEVSRRFEEIGANVKTCRCWRREINPLDSLAFYDLFKLCRKERFDIVHTHTSKGGFLGRIAARTAGVPIVIHTIHGFSFNEFTPWMKTSFYVCLEKIANHFCNTMISVTEQHRMMAIEKGIAKPNKIVKIHNGIELKGFEDGKPIHTMRNDLGLNEKSILIGTVGRLTPEKGQGYLVNAMPIVIDKYPQVHFVFIGDGPYEGGLKDLASALGVRDRCSFLGFRRDVPDLLKCMDIFVQPSPREGLSITLLEAMAAKKPVIATDITGNQEVVDHNINGILCQPMSETALAEALVSLVKNRNKRIQLGNQARKKVEQHFSEKMMLEQTVQLYHEQIKRSQGRHFFPRPFIKGITRDG
jgi:glycosyltransferase involved in cell wall biosynthesis